MTLPLTRPPELRDEGWARWLASTRSLAAGPTTLPPCAASTWTRQRDQFWLAGRAAFSTRGHPRDRPPLRRSTPPLRERVRYPTGLASGRAARGLRWWRPSSWSSTATGAGDSSASPPDQDDTWRAGLAADEAEIVERLGPDGTFMDELGPRAATAPSRLKDLPSRYREAFAPSWPVGNHRGADQIPSRPAGLQRPPTTNRLPRPHGLFGRLRAGFHTPAVTRPPTAAKERPTDGGRPARCAVVETPLRGDGGQGAGMRVFGYAAYRPRAHTGRGQVVSRLASCPCCRRRRTALTAPQKTGRPAQPAGGPAGSTRRLCRGGPPGGRAGPGRVGSRGGRAAGTAAAALAPSRSGRRTCGDQASSLDRVSRRRRRPGAARCSRQSRRVCVPANWCECVPTRPGRRRQAVSFLIQDAADSRCRGPERRSVVEPTDDNKSSKRTPGVNVGGVPRSFSGRSDTRAPPTPAPCPGPPAGRAVGGPSCAVWSGSGDDGRSAAGEGAGRRQGLGDVLRPQVWSSSR